MSEEFNELVIKRCLTVVKQSLKSKGFTYSDVANFLQVSENTVKRMLNQSDISFDRLLKLADLCGLDIGEVIKQSRENPASHYLFTDRQDNAFDKMPHLLAYFGELFYLKKTVKDIQQEHGLSPLSTYKYLRMLEDIELIELFPENKFKFLVNPPLGFASDSRVLKKSIKKHIEQTCEVVMSTQDNKSHFMRVKPIRISQRLFNELEKDLKQVIDKYAELAEMTYADSQDNPAFQVTIVGHPFNPEGFDEIPIINIDN